MKHLRFMGKAIPRRMQHWLCRLRNGLQVGIGQIEFVTGGARIGVVLGDQQAQSAAHQQAWPVECHSGAVADR